MTSFIRSNEYSAGIRRLPEEKLREYIERPEDFHEEAILAAIWELSNRRKLRIEERRLETAISVKLYPQQVENTEVISPDLSMNGTLLPSLYSMRAIQIFSVLFSVIAGGILMAINFNRINRRTEALKVLGFALIYTLFSFTIFSLLGTQSPFLTVILNLIGALLIDQLFWRRILGNEFRFNKQQIWSALIIALVLISPLIWYIIKSGVMETL